MRGVPHPGYAPGVGSLSAAGRSAQGSSDIPTPWARVISAALQDLCREFAAIRFVSPGRKMP